MFACTGTSDDQPGAAAAPLSTSKAQGIDNLKSGSERVRGDPMSDDVHAHWHGDQPMEMAASPDRTHAGSSAPASTYAQAVRKSNAHVKSGMQKMDASDGGPEAGFAPDVTLRHAY